jgi:ATP-binding cassette subfamily B protein
MLREIEGTGAIAEPALLAAEEAARPSPSIPVVSARSVSFHHAGAPEGLLEACDLEVRPGEKLVLEGRSGCGKSTLASILAGLRAPDAGLVLAGGLDRKILGDRGWRARIALAPQFHENHVFGGSLLFNLLMGRSWPPSPEDVREAEETCARLGLGPLLARMPGGILQWVGETGWRLSHGERARVWIARALLQGSQLLLVDEGLDALDPRSLARVQEVLLEERAAVLLVAHP